MSSIGSLTGVVTRRRGRRACGVLDELDWELDRRGHRFVRYADDGNVYVKTERESG